MNSGNNIPRKIWLLWFQGLEQAPFVVKECINSWKVNNPDWEITVLDSENLPDYSIPELNKKTLTKLDLTKQSNIVRLKLLSEYGGVWADATTYCMKPLDEWIHDYTDSGFFAFYKPGKDRLISTWFIACEPENTLITEWLRYSLDYFENNTFINRGRKRLKARKLLIKLFNQSTYTTRLWFSPLVTKLLKIYPYPIFHYMFERVVSTKPVCGQIWENTEKFSADIPHAILNAGLFSEPEVGIKNHIDQRLAPLYKLSWKYDESRYSEGTLLHYLLEDRYMIDISSDKV